MIYSSYGSPDDKNFLYSLAAASKQAINTMLGRNMLLFVVIVFGLLYFLYSQKEWFILNVSIILSFALSIISASIVPLGYYYIPIMVFSLIGYIALYDMGKKLKTNLIKNNSSNNRYVISTYITTLLIIFCLTVANNGLISENLNKITQRNRKPSCQNQVADIICSNDNEEHSLLEVLSLDSGFYTASGVVPKSKYFYIPNISFEKYPYAIIGQYEDLESKVNEYVITTFKVDYNEEIEFEPINNENYSQKIANAIAKNYNLVETIKGTYLQEDRKMFYLYRRVD